VHVRAEVDEFNGWSRLRFPFHRPTIDALKTYPGAIWDKERRCWQVPNSLLPSIRWLVHDERVVRTARDLPLPEEIAGRLRDYQVDGARFLVARRGALLTMDMRTGKLGRVSSPILTPTGWRPMGELRAGDPVIDPDTGDAVPVEAVFPQGRKPIYRVTFNDGAFTDVGLEHLWLVETPSQKYRGTGPQVLTTQELLEKGLRWTGHSEKENRGQGNRKWFIPLTKPVHFAERGPRLVDPWLLGALLADGHFGTTLRISKTYPDFIDRVRRALPDGELLPGTKPQDWRFRGAAKLRLWLVAYGLIGKRSWEKFIPSEYLFAPPAEREELLRGLMDGDGDCSLGSNGDQCIVSFNTTSPQLRDGVLWLVQSLGGYATVDERPEPKYTYLGETKTGRPSWRLAISLPTNPFSIKAKAERWRPSRLARAIDSIEYIDDDEAVCIRVASKRSLYLTDSFIVTHNTPTAIAAACALFAGKEIDCLLVLYPNSVMESWRAQLEDWAGLTLFPLQGLAPLDPETVAELRMAPWLVIGCHYEILEKRAECLRQLLAWRRYAVVADEIQHCKNRKIKRTEMLHDLSKSDFCKAAWGLSGTPMRNRPRDLFALFEFVQPLSMGYGYWKNFAARYCNAHQDAHGHWDDKGKSHEEELQTRLAGISFRRTRAEVAQWLPKADHQLIFCAVGAEDLKRYQKLERHFAGAIGRTLDDADRGSDAETLRALVQATSEAKIPTAIERATLHVERGVKVIVFAHFHETLQGLDETMDKRKAADPDTAAHFCAGGWMLPEKRRAMIERWRACSGPAILLANTQSSGVGIDLADAEVAIFLELEWVPADLRQAMDRIQDVHLGKRKTPPLYEFLLMKGTVDEAMATAVLAKEIGIQQIVGHDPELQSIAATLRSSGVADTSRLGLANSNAETIRAAMQSLRAKFLSPDVEAPRTETLAQDLGEHWEPAQDEVEAEEVPF